MKSLICLLFSICLPTSIAAAQACGFGKGEITVFNEKNEPVKKFKITFYEVDGFDYDNKPVVQRAQFIGNAWDIFLTAEEAEPFLKDKKPFTYEWFTDPQIVYYKDNVFHFRTFENGGNLVITKVSARRYESFYFISPVFSGCYNLHKITLKKK